MGLISRPRALGQAAARGHPRDSRRAEDRAISCDDRERWQQPIDISDTELGFLGATASAIIQGQTGGQYPAPMAALELMLGAAGVDVDAAGDRRSQGMAAPVRHAGQSGPDQRLLPHRSQQERHRHRAHATSSRRPIKSVGVIGAGIMGQGIAAANLKRELPVAHGRRRARGAVPRACSRCWKKSPTTRRRKRPDAAARPCKFAALLNPATVDAELARCDLVIEAIVENPEVKKAALRPARAAVDARRDPGLEHVDHSDHASWPRD